MVYKQIVLASIKFCRTYCCLYALWICFAAKRQLILDLGNRSWPNNLLSKWKLIQLFQQMGFAKYSWKWSFSSGQAPKSQYYIGKSVSYMPHNGCLIHSSVASNIQPCWCRCSHYDLTLITATPLRHSRQHCLPQLSPPTGVVHFANGDLWSYSLRAHSKSRDFSAKSLLPFFNGQYLVKSER